MAQRLSRRLRLSTGRAVQGQRGPISGAFADILLKIYADVVTVVPLPQRTGLVLIGGTAMLSLGSTRSTSSVDIAFTQEAMGTFLDAIRDDVRFLHVEADGTLHYRHRKLDILVPINFFEIGGKLLSPVQRLEGAEAGFRPCVQELLIITARSLLDRSDPSDFQDLAFLLDLILDRLAPPDLKDQESLFRFLERNMFNVDNIRIGRADQDILRRGVKKLRRELDKVGSAS